MPQAKSVFDRPLFIIRTKIHIEEAAKTWEQ